MAQRGPYSSGSPSTTSLLSSAPGVRGDPRLRSMASEASLVRSSHFLALFSHSTRQSVARTKLVTQTEGPNPCPLRSPTRYVSRLLHTHTELFSKRGCHTTSFRYHRIPVSGAPTFPWITPKATTFSTILTPGGTVRMTRAVTSSPPEDLQTLVVSLSFVWVS